jgi:signal transduction histidine kinase
LILFVDSVFFLNFSAAEQLLRILNNILDLSKMEAKKMEVSNEPFDFYQKMEGILEGFHFMASRKNIYLLLLLPVDLPSVLIGDSTRLGQVLYNFISNAIKFTQQGGVTIKVQVTGTRPNGLQVSFQVIDTGKGISPNDLKLLFERFSQLERPRTTPIEGTGLGLAVS